MRGLGAPAVAWILYDFASTIFSYAVLTRYFNEWIVIQRGRPDWVVGLMSLCVAAALLLSLPFFGALADRSGRRKPLLVAFTLLSVGATASLALAGSVGVALVLAGVAIFGFNSALAHYDPLLATVASPARSGLVSGLGVGVGYVGVLVAIAVLSPTVPPGDNQAAFLPTAALFLIFALPCFLLVRERGPRGAPEGRAEPARAPTSPRQRSIPGGLLGLAADLRGHWRVLRRIPGEASTQLIGSVRRAARAPYGRLLLARFLYVDAIATVIAFLTVYARRTGTFSAGELDLLLALSTGFAVVGAIIAGLLIERVGPKRVLQGTLVLVAAALLVSGISGLGWLLWLVGPAVGTGLGAVWTCDRVFLLRLAPAECRGEAFGLYAFVGKASSGVGPFLLWGGTVWLLSDALALMDAAAAGRVAVCVLAASALAGLAVLRPLREPWSTPQLGSRR